MTFKVKFNFKVKIYPILELVRAITHHLFKLESPNLGKRCKIPWIRSLLFWWLIGLDRSNYTLSKNPVYLHRFACLKYLLDMQKQSLMHSSTSHMAPHICRFPYVSQKVASWTVNQSSIVKPSGRRLGGGFYKLL